jgi:hypothetical protein
MHNTKIKFKYALSERGAKVCSGAVPSVAGRSIWRPAPSLSLAVTAQWAGPTTRSHAPVFAYLLATLIDIKSFYWFRAF